MINFDQVKVTPREQQVLNLLVQGCSNKEIGGQLHISLRTVKQHLCMLFSRAGIRKGRQTCEAGSLCSRRRKCSHDPL
jgi:NarL family two-component system response regulator LiaR